jgi:hypothetical protein
MLPVAAFAQTISGANETEKFQEKQFDEKLILEKADPNQTFRHPKPINTKAEWLYDITTIGETQYDLQVNGSLANRVLLHDDGSVSTVFTFASDGSPHLTRGTGYAHFNGANWSDMPLSRLEDDRAGWCNIGTVEKDGKTVEFVVSHHATADANAQSGGLYIIMNDEIGSNNWTIVDKYEVGENGHFWPRAVGSGKYIHVFAAWNTEDGNRMHKGMRYPNTYFRYDVDADEWIDEEMLMPDYNDTTVYLARSDAYQMDVDGDNVAIVSGGLGQNLFLFKSTDNGDNWTTTIVDTLAIPAYSGNGTTNGEIWNHAGGSVEVLLDADGNAHVWFGLAALSDDTPDDSTYSYFPGLDAIFYWNEKDRNFVQVGSTVDLNNDDTTTFPIQQFPTTSNGLGTEGSAIYTNNTLACFPDAGIDADGNIFLVYSAPNEDALSPEGPVYRDVYVTYSTDGGLNWSSPQPIIEGYETEDVFCHIARDVDDNLHLVWQRDDFAGTSIINNGYHPATLSKILYAAVPKSLVLNNQFKIERTSINENNVSFKVSKAYPNPTTGNSFVNVNLEKNSVVKVQITNLVGQEVSSTYVGELAAGSNRIELATQNLNNGVYIYNVFVGNTSVSGRVIVE